MPEKAAPEIFFNVVGTHKLVIIRESNNVGVHHENEQVAGKFNLKFKIVNVPVFNNYIFVYFGNFFT